MRLLVLFKFIPRQPWRPKYWLMLSAYWRFRVQTMGCKPTLRESWRYLEWCRQMNKDHWYREKL